MYVENRGGNMICENCGYVIGFMGENWKSIEPYIDESLRFCSLECLNCYEAEIIKKIKSKR